MKLINLDHSPYATRVRILIRKKKLDVDIIAPPEALKSPEFMEKFPLGKIPLLVLDEEDCLPESIAIMEYLEARFPKHRCIPADPLLAAKSRVLSSFTDTHLGPALLPFFKAMLLPDFSFNQAEQERVVRTTLANLDRWFLQNTILENPAISMGDMVLAPTLWYVKVTMPLFAIDNIMEGLDQVSAWWDWVNQDTEVNDAIIEMKTAFDAFLNSK